MRYTTIIDYREFPAVARNRHACLVYVHMALACGYHDHDQDLLDKSIRNLAAELHFTVSATRHALGLLERSGLITRDGQRWRIRKRVIEQFPASKPTSKTSAAARERIEKEQEEARRWREDLRRVVDQSSRQELETWLQKLEAAPAGRNVYLKGARLWANPEHIEWLKRVIAKL